MLASSEVAVRFAIVDKTGAAIGDKATFFFGSQVENLGAAERAAIDCSPLQRAVAKCNVGPLQRLARPLRWPRGTERTPLLRCMCAAPGAQLAHVCPGTGLGPAHTPLTAPRIVSGELIAPGKKH